MNSDAQHSIEISDPAMADAPAHIEQLRMVATEVISVHSWKLDRADIERGLRGVAQARATLAVVRERLAEIAPDRLAA